MELGLGDLYSERALANGIDHHKADLICQCSTAIFLHVSLRVHGGLHLDC